VAGEGATATTMIKRAIIVSSKVLACYLAASLALLLFAMWPYYRWSEIPAALAEDYG